MPHKPFYVLTCLTRAYQHNIFPDCFAGTLLEKSDAVTTTHTISKSAVECEQSEPFAPTKTYHRLYGVLHFTRKRNNYGPVCIHDQSIARR